MKSKAVGCGVLDAPQNNRTGRCYYHAATRILSLIVSLAMLFSITAGIDLSAYATSRTQSEAVNWANSQKGKSLDYDGAYGAQCVDLIYYYYQYLGVSPQGGDASAYINNSLPSGWKRVYSNFQPGDIAVWKVNHSCGTCTTSSYGHIGIITSADSTGFNAINQNFNGASYCTQNWFYCSALACAIRPNWNSGNVAPISFNSQSTTAIGNDTATINFKISNPNNNLVNKVGARIRKSDSSDWKYYEETLPANVYKSSTLTTFYVVGAGKEFNYSLIPGTNYVWQAYAVTGGKTYYGSTITFKTSGTAPIPHTHTWNSGVITRSPTCYSTGVKTYTCTCGATKTETIAKTSHSYSWKNSGGYIANSCNNCGNEKIRLPFEDLYGYEYYGDYIAYTSVYNKFITGTNPPYKTLFSPTTPITRAMFVTILYRMAGEPYANGGNPYTSSPFTDITNTSVYYYDAACWALKNGVTTETTFKPFNNVTREQTATFLYRYAQDNDKLGDTDYKNVNLNAYHDGNSISHFAVDAMKWANYNGMITGTQQGYANPQGATQRIHATKILYGFGKTCNIGKFA